MVHASKIPDKAAMEKFGFANLPCGFIVGRTKLIGVKRYKGDEEFDKDKDKHLANKNWGEYGFILEDAQRFDKLIPAKGMLGFWEYLK